MPDKPVEPPVKPEKRKRPRRITILDTNMYPMTGLDGEPMIIDVSGIPHANTQACLMVQVQEQCDLGFWHQSSLQQIPPWGAD
jgi:hypothetical protein